MTSVVHTFHQTRGKQAELRDRRKARSCKAQVKPREREAVREGLKVLGLVFTSIHIARSVFKMVV
jgi:hypothetical protein